jgi:lipopolysaccharide export system protein LptC
LTSISFAGAERATAVPARPRGDSEQTYRRALRHSRLVRWLRAMLIAVVAVLLLAVVVENYLPVGELRLPTDLGTLLIRNNSVIMQQPRIAGFTADSRPYEFTANSAQQDIAKPDLVELQQIRAKVQMADKSMVHMWADSGHYNMKTEMLTLSDNIHLVSSAGYEARLKQASVNMKKGDVVSDTPVWVKLLDGDLDAKQLEILNNGDLLRFTDVRMILQSSKPETKASEP